MEIVSREKFLKSRKKKEKESLESVKLSNLERCANKLSKGIMVCEISNKEEVHKFLKKELAKFGWGVEFFTRTSGKKRPYLRQWVRFGDLD